MSADLVALATTNITVVTVFLSYLFRASENRGWELLWLATGVIVPSERIMHKLVSFLHKSAHLLASQCYVRLHHTKR